MTDLQTELSNTAELLAASTEAQRGDWLEELGK